MGYYDSVKDSVRENNKENTGSSAGGGSFDTLKENAEKTSEEENKGDDTPIEVLEEDGLKRENPNKQEEKTVSSNESGSTGSNPLTSSGSSSEGEVSQDLSSLESKMDKLIEQNERMIEILESFGQ